MSDPAQVVLLAVSAIVVPEARLRALKTLQAEAIGRSIAAIGQLEPIAVTRLPGRSEPVLVDGWHRLEGCRLAGLETIEARVVSPSRAARVRHEAVTGIARAAHDALDRAAAVDALVRLAREDAGLPPEGDLRSLNRFPSRACQRIDQDSNESVPHLLKSMGWAVHADLAGNGRIDGAAVESSLAETMGVSARAVRRLRRIHLRLPAAIKARLRAAGGANEVMALDVLASTSEAEMDRACTFLEEGRAETLTAAIALLRAPPGCAPSPAERAKNAFLRRAARWTPRERQDFWHAWQRAWHPDGRPRAKARG